MIQLQYTDDGKGFDIAENKQGYGLDNIHARVALLNGRIEWQTGVNQSTNVLVSIPYNHP
jgi:signal transduction histidine kinase